MQDRIENKILWWCKVMKWDHLRQTYLFGWNNVSVVSWLESTIWNNGWTTFVRVPIINGVNKHDGALVWFDKSSLENIFNSDGNKSFSATAFGTDLGVVTSTERLLTSFYLGRSNPFSNLFPYIWIFSDPGRAAWRKTKMQSQTFTQTLSLQLLPLRWSWA